MATFDATIDRQEKSTTLRLGLNPALEIVLTDDKPNAVKAVFNKLLEALKKEKIEFKLVDQKEDLYYHICKEYLTQLNSELKSTYKELQDHGLLAEKSK